MASITLHEKDVVFGGVHFRNMTLYEIDGKHYRRGRKFYERIWASYPDVVNLLQFRKMLGIGDCYARKLMHENRVKHFFIKPDFMIPKVWVIDFVMSKYYAECPLRKKV